MSVKITDDLSIRAGTIGKWFLYGCATSLVLLNVREIAAIVYAVA